MFLGGLLEQLHVSNQFIVVLSVAIPSLLIFLTIKQFTVPRQLAHLPKVPILPLLWSYASGEAESDRIERLILPFANERGEGVVVVYALGRWIVHCLDAKVILLILRDRL